MNSSFFASPGFRRFLLLFFFFRRRVGERDCLREEPLRSETDLSRVRRRLLWREALCWATELGEASSLILDSRHLSQPSRFCLRAAEAQLTVFIGVGVYESEA